MAASAPPPCPVLDVVLIKLGGAALTDKAGWRVLKPAAVTAAATAVGRAVAVGAVPVLVHGAGAFGHAEAAAGSLASADPASAPAQTPLAVAACRASLAALHSAVLDAAVAAGVPAVTASAFPAAHARCCGGYVRATVDALAHGCVPVLHGDPVWVDDAPARGDGSGAGAGAAAWPRRTRVVSGDEIVAVLSDELHGRVIALTPAGAAAWGLPPAAAPLHGAPAAALAAAVVVRAAVFITGADGVFTAPPDRPELVPRLISRVVVVVGAGDAGGAGGAGGGVAFEVEGGGAGGGDGRASGSPAPALLTSDPSGVDVTGGIRAKIDVAVAMVKVRAARGAVHPWAAGGDCGACGSWAAGVAAGARPASPAGPHPLLVSIIGLPAFTAAGAAALGRGVGGGETAARGAGDHAAHPMAAVHGTHVFTAP
jgi:isopentenyl phosphate kinase